MKAVKRLKTLFLVLGAIILIIIIGMIVKQPSERYVLLSFDVEPVDGIGNVTEVLSILDNEGINATFFVTGEYATEHPDVLLLMSEYEIACHGYTHKKFTKMNYTEKKSEIERCGDAVKNTTGREVIGFRAPYTRIDHETLMLLDEEGFTYDASVINGLSIFYPSLTGHRIGEIPISSFMGIPLEDVVWLYYMHMKWLYFFVLEHKNNEINSYLFHPHHITRHKNEFNLLIRHLKERNVTFISHQQLILQHEGVRTGSNSSNSVIHS